MKKLLTALLFAPAVALASGAGVHLDKAPDVQGDKAALQSGARTFVNYCLNCHGASFVRYSRLTDLGLTDQQVKDNLMFTAVKIAEPMRVAARPDEQKLWFGAAPPDLTLVARARDITHWNALRDLGVVHVERELFESSLRSGRTVLE